MEEVYGITVEYEWCINMIIILYIYIPYILPFIENNRRKRAQEKA